MFQLEGFWDKDQLFKHPIYLWHVSKYFQQFLVANWENSLALPPKIQHVASSRTTDLHLFLTNKETSFALLLDAKLLLSITWPPQVDFYHTKMQRKRKVSILRQYVTTMSQRKMVGKQTWCAWNAWISGNIKFFSFVMRTPRSWTRQSNFLPPCFFHFRHPYCAFLKGQSNSSKPSPKLDPFTQQGSLSFQIPS